jgi:hypothetical protein
MMRMFPILIGITIFTAVAVHAQTPATLPDAPTPSPDTPTVRNLPRNLVHDQAAIWTSPVHPTEAGAFEGIVLVAGAAALGAEDRHIMQNHFLNKNMNNEANSASDGLVGLFGAAPLAFWGIGRLQHDDNAAQTGVMGGEAIIDSLIVNQAIRICARREPPTVDDAKGKFFATPVGFSSSFPSNHSIVAWSSAAVIASAYNGFMTKALAYGLASGVTLTRVMSRNHFPSDVWVGSGLGWMIGHYVYHRHNQDQY